jgi:SEC-C motif-containing protein
LLPLCAKKSTKSKTGGGGGFGGAALEPCPCGSSDTYSRCCGKIHKDVNAYKSAKAEQVARARYSAYAKKQADFLMATTHPLHKDFNSDLKQWKEQIK